MTGIELTNLEKIFWPEVGFTKGQMVDYYERIADVMLPHLAGRAATLARFPDGMQGPGWYQTNCRGAPPWMRTAEVRGRRGETFRFCVVDDARSLLWLANMGTVELHPFLDRVDRRGEPTSVVFDLDPGPPAGLAEACRVAVRLRDALGRQALSAVAKTSGGKGLHVYVPIAPGHGYDATKSFARSVAARLAAEMPEHVVDRSPRALRVGKVLVDWLQNDPGRSTAAPYSLRARARPIVSTPLLWHEVAAVAEGGAERLSFGPAEVVRRVEERGDLFAGALSERHELPDADARRA